MPDSRPLISVALSVYNGARYLPQQLDSILAQRDVELEIVAVDDGSRDDSLAVLQTFAARDPRISVHPNPENLGLTRSFERAMSLCRGEFIAPSDQDDVWQPDKLARLLSAIGEHALVYGDSAYMDAAGQPTGRRVSDDLTMLHGTNPMQFVFANSASGHAMLLRRSLFERCRPLPPAIYYDWSLAMFAAASGGIGYLDETLVQFRRHVQAYSAVGKAATARPADANLRWLNERMQLLQAWIDSGLGDVARAAAMRLAIERAHAGVSRLPLLAALWRERRGLYPQQRWPALPTLKLYQRMLRKLRRASAEAA